MGEWSNMIGYDLGSLAVGVCNMAKTSPVENFKNGWLSDMDANMATLFVRRVLQRFGFLGKPKRNLTSKELQLGGYVFIVFSILSAMPIIVSNSLVLGWKFLTDQCTSSIESRPRGCPKIDLRRTPTKKVLPFLQPCHFVMLEVLH